jgi:putative MATE family efflux protein
MKDNKRTLDLTRGPIWLIILRFGLPLLLGSMIQLLYNTVDLIYVGRFVSKEASAAVGASSMLVTLLVGLFTGLSAGVSVVTSKAFGSHDRDRLLLTVRNAMGLSVIGGLVISALGIIFSPSLLRLMNTPESIMDQASAYIRVYFVSVLFLISYNMCTGCLRAIGNSRYPMYIQLAGGILNVFLDWLFIIVMDNGVMGVAYATLICQALTCAASLWLLRYCLPDLELGRGIFSIDRQIFLDIIRIGVPAGVQSMVITLSNVLVQSQINSLGVDSISAFTYYFKVELIIYLPIMAFGHTLTTFTGQNMGAGDRKRTRRGLLICTAMSGGYAAAAVFLLLRFFGRAAFGLFTADQSIIDLGMRIISISFPFYWLYSILENISDTCRGAGNSLKPMIFILLNICVLRTGLLMFFMKSAPGLSAVASVYPISWAGAAICLSLYYLFSPWAKKTFR